MLINPTNTASYPILHLFQQEQDSDSGLFYQAFSFNKNNRWYRQLNRYTNLTGLRSHRVSEGRF